MKYKVGDKVKVREDLEEERYYGNHMFTCLMRDYKGKVVTIEKCTDHGYMIEEDKIGWGFTDEMFEGSVKENKEPHKGCEFCNDDFYRAFTEKNGTIKFNKIKMLNIVVCITDMDEKIIAIVNSDERIKVGSKVKVKYRCKDEKECSYSDAKVISSLKILKKYYKDFYDAVYMQSLYDTLLGCKAEVAGIYKEETKVVQKEEIVETLEEI